MTAPTQAVAAHESRTERASVTLTKAEKEALRLVASVDRTDESTLLRDFTVADVTARAEQIRERLARGV